MLHIYNTITWGTGCNAIMGTLMVVLILWKGIPFLKGNAKKRRMLRRRLNKHPETSDKYKATKGRMRHNLQHLAFGLMTITVFSVWGVIKLYVAYKFIQAGELIYSSEWGTSLIKEVSTYEDITVLFLLLANSWGLTHAKEEEDGEFGY